MASQRLAFICQLRHTWRKGERGEKEVLSSCRWAGPCCVPLRRLSRGVLGAGRSWLLPAQLGRSRRDQALD